MCAGIELNSGRARAAFSMAVATAAKKKREREREREPSFHLTLRAGGVISDGSCHQVSLCTAPLYLPRADTARRSRNGSFGLSLSRAARTRSITGCLSPWLSQRILLVSLFFQEHPVHCRSQQIFSFPPKLFFSCTTSSKLGKRPYDQADLVARMGIISTSSQGWPPPPQKSNRLLSLPLQSRFRSC